MKLFDIENGKVVLKASSLAIPEFKQIWDRDKDPDKVKAYQELSYITFLCDASLDNPYRNYAEFDRDKVLKKDFFGTEDAETDELVDKAIEKYKETQDTVSVRLLRSARSAADKLSKYFDKVDFDQMDKMGKPVYSAKDLSSNLKEIGSIVKSLSVLEDQVKKEQTNSARIRGGIEIGDYEIADPNFNYRTDEEE